MDDAKIKKVLTRMRRTHGKTYAPLRYFRGLRTVRDVETKYKKMRTRTLTVNTSVKTRPSSYTLRFKRRYGPNVTSLPQIARATGIPLRVIRAVFKRGLAAWRTGHRPGTTPHQWAYARVHSYVMKGKTYHTANKNLQNK